MAVKATTRVPAVPQKRRLSKMRVREEISGMLWTSPWWAGFLAFSLYPTIIGLYYSFTNSRWVGGGAWVGLQNYVVAITQDARFWPAIGKTLYYAGVTVPLTLAASLFAASILNQKLKGENFFRTIFYIPSLMPEIALVVMWGWILNPDFGLLNYVIKDLTGLKGPGWLLSAKWAMPALFMMVVWGSFGGVGMLIFLSSLQSVPQELYEACDLDGGSPLQKFLNITVPSISPAIFFNLILGIIGALNSFLLMFLAPEPPGGPNFATYTLGFHMYQQGFVEGRMAYANAMAWLLFLIIFAIILVNWKISGRWVFMASMQDEG
ncbi:MAG: sugar ABC transporter permease [Anaerolineae bacterium]|nr:sugar ABC transporter permease [Anaerolineae bacterium]